MQGTRLALGTRQYERDTINGGLCLLRGPRSLGMGDFWIGIVRHDETSYMTGRLYWLVRHVAGRGKKRKLLFAKSERSDAPYDAASREGIWDKTKVEEFNKLIH